jgi:hypothetical protein
LPQSSIEKLSFRASPVLCNICSCILISLAKLCDSIIFSGEVNYLSASVMLIDTFSSRWVNELFCLSNLLVVLLSVQFVP